MAEGAGPSQQQAVMELKRDGKSTTESTIRQKSLLLLDLDRHIRHANTQITCHREAWKTPLDAHIMHGSSGKDGKGFRNTYRKHRVRTLPNGEEKVGPLKSALDRKQNANGFIAPMFRAEVHFRLASLLETEYSGTLVKKKEKAAEIIDTYFNYKIGFKKSQLSSLSDKNAKAAQKLFYEIRFMEEAYSLIKLNVLRFIEEKWYMDQEIDELPIMLKNKIGDIEAQFKEGIDKLASDMDAKMKRVKYWKKVLDWNKLAVFGSPITGFGAARGLLETPLGKLFIDWLHSFVPKFPEEFLREGVSGVAAGLFYLPVHFGKKSIGRKEARFNEEQAKAMKIAEGEKNAKIEAVKEEIQQNADAIRLDERSLKNSIIQGLDAWYNTILSEYGFSQSPSDVEMAKIDRLMNKNFSQNHHEPTNHYSGPAASANPDSVLLGLLRFQPSY